MEKETVEKGWWEGDGRAEHLLDVALPHEDHEEVIEPGFQPGRASIAAGIVLLAGFVILFALTFIYAVEDWF